MKSQKSEKEFEENGDENKNFTEMDDVKKYIKTHKKENVSPSDQTFKKWIQKWTKKSFGQWQVIEFLTDRIFN